MATGAAAILAAAVAGYGIWSYFRANQDDTKTTTTEAMAPQEALKYFIDKAHEEIKTLYKTEALARSQNVSDVRYKTCYALLRGGTTFEGVIEINFSLKTASEDVFVDYKGDKVHSLVINGQRVTDGEPFHDHRVFFDKKHL